MAVYQKFEDLPVWKLAKDLAVKIYQIRRMKNSVEIMGWSTRFEEHQFLFQVMSPRGLKEDQKGNSLSFFILLKVPWGR
jgi:hypothetical protein